METIVFGDIHGSTFWKKAIAENPDCRYVFLGDYLDPYENISHKQLIDNLKAIIKLKKVRPDDVVLLLGNHDLHYLHSHIEPCWRFDYDIEDAAHALFYENADLFQHAFQEGKHIFTHAGISETWFYDDFGGDPNKNIAHQLNNPHRDQLPALFRIGAMRGGDINATGGIFWADLVEIMRDPLQDYTQYVGHNRVERVREYIALNDGQVVFCDCLYNKKYLKLDF